MGPSQGPRGAAGSPQKLRALGPCVKTDTRTPRDHCEVDAWAWSGPGATLRTREQRENLDNLDMHLDTSGSRQRHLTLLTTQPPRGHVQNMTLTHARARPCGRHSRQAERRADRTACGAQKQGGARRRPRRGPRTACGAESQEGDVPRAPRSRKPAPQEA